MRLVPFIGTIALLACHADYPQGSCGEACAGFAKAGCGETYKCLEICVKAVEDDLPMIEHLGCLAHQATKAGVRSCGETCD